MGYIDKILLVCNILCFPILAWGALKKPTLGLGILIAILPILNLSRRLFSSYASNPYASYPYPSLESAAVLVLWCCTMIRGIRRNIPPSPVAISTKLALLLFAITGLLSSLFSKDLILSLKIYLTGGLIPFICFTIAARYTILDNGVKNIALGFLVLAFLTSVNSLLQYNRLQGYYGIGAYDYDTLYDHLNVISTFVVPSGTIASIIIGIPLAAWYMNYAHAPGRIFGAVVLALSLYSAVLSMSRGTWIGIAAAMVGIIPLFAKRFRISGLLPLLTAALLLSYLGFARFIEGAIEYRSGGYDPTSTFRVRAANYALSLMSSTKHAILGLGLGQYRNLYSEFPHARASYYYPLWFAHSLFLTLIPEIGLLGTLAYAISFFSPIVRFLKSAAQISYKLRELLYSFSVGIVSFVIVASTSGIHLVSYTMGLNHKATYFTSPHMIGVWTALGVLVSATSQTSLLQKKDVYSQQSMSTQNEVCT